jgi:hypothetical protein
MLCSTINFGRILRSSKARRRCRVLEAAQSELGFFLFDKNGSGCCGKLPVMIENN